ncbi:MAG: hypothetical protein LBN01_00195 [Endomicrobium sp.]|nr:hypothetical protein [Endomicrobium sp.]
MRKIILEKYFNMNEEDGIGSEKDKKQRLCGIISHSEKNDINMEDIQAMSKCRYNYSDKYNFPLRIYVKKRDKFVYIYFIDIYHLAWTDKKNNDPTTLYNEHKPKKFCLSNLNETKQQSQK